MNYFFYGILMDRDILAGVIERKMPGCRLTKAWLEGYRRVCVKGENYPLLVPMADSRVEGVFIRGISSEESNRIADFEDDYVAETLTVILETGDREPALVFVHNDLSRASEQEWVFDTWRRHHKY